MGHAEDEGVKVDMGQLLRSLTDGRKADKGTSKSGKQGTKDATHAESNAKPLRSTLLSPRLSEAW